MSLLRTSRSRESVNGRWQLSAARLPTRGRHPPALARRLVLRARHARSRLLRGYERSVEGRVQSQADRAGLGGGSRPSQSQSHWRVVVECRGGCFEAWYRGMNCKIGHSPAVPAVVKVVWGMFSEHPRPLHEACLCRECAQQHWEMSKGPVTAMLMYYELRVQS